MDSTVVGADGGIRYDDICVAVGWDSLRDLAVEYWRYARLSEREKRTSDMAARDCVMDVVTEPAWSRALELVDILIELAIDDDEIGLVAAGPLEELVQPGQATAFVEQIETRARCDSTFRRAVHGIWLSRDTSADINRRLALFGACFPDGSLPV